MRFLSLCRGIVVDLLVSTLTDTLPRPWDRPQKGSYMPGYGFEIGPDNPTRQLRSVSFALHQELAKTLPEQSGIDYGFGDWYARTAVRLPNSPLARPQISPPSPPALPPRAFQPLLVNTSSFLGFVSDPIKSHRVVPCDSQASRPPIPKGRAWRGLALHSSTIQTGPHLTRPSPHYYFPYYFWSSNVYTAPRFG